MRVLIVHNRYRSAQPSGENSVVEDEARLLADHGCVVEQLETTSDSIATWPAHKKAALPVRVVWSREGKRLTEDAVARFRPDVVHFHNTFPVLSPSAFWGARQSGVAVVHTLHNFRPLCASGMFFRDGKVCEECLGRFPWPALAHGTYRESRLKTVPLVAMIGLHRRLDTWLRCIDRLLTPSDFARRKYVEAGWPADRFDVKYNTTPHSDLERAPGARDFVCLSRLTESKGMNVLLDAWARAFPDGGQRLVIVGAGVCLPELRRQAERLGAGTVEFRGQLPRPEAMRVLATARACVIPSSGYEVFPRTLVEAYSVGVPVLASRLGPHPELIDDGPAGLLFEPCDADDLARQLRRLAESDELANRLARAAKHLYETRYSPERTTKHLLEIYARARREREAA